VKDEPFVRSGIFEAPSIVILKCCQDEAENTPDEKPITMTSRPILQGPILAYPALHNGLLYVRNDEELLCVDLRRASDSQLLEDRNNPRRRGYE
jgi:hypothetical protein